MYIQNNQKIIDKLLSYIIAKEQKCPFDKIKYKYLNECVGYGKARCKDCLLQHIEELKIPPIFNYEMNYTKMIIVEEDEYAFYKIRMY